MKKILILMVTLFTTFAFASAKDDVTVESGSLLELKVKKELKLFIVWDYSNSTIEGKETNAFLKEKGQKWIEDYPKEIETAEKWLKDKVNKKSKTTKIVDSKADADYVITIKAADFNYGSTGVSVMIGFGAGDAHMSGKAIITKADSEQTIAVLDINGVPGDGYGNERRRCNAYEQLGKWIAKLIKKAK